MLDVQWTDEAIRDLEQILDYIAFDSESAAERLNRLLLQSILVACEFPNGFKAGRTQGTREIVAHPNYIMFIASWLIGLTSSPSSTPARNTRKKSLSS